MKRIASLVAAALAVLVLAASVSAAPTSITLDQAQPVAPGSQVTFTVTGKRAALVRNECVRINAPSVVETNTADSSFTIPSDASACTASVLDANGEALPGKAIFVRYCVAQPGRVCFFD